MLLKAAPRNESKPLLRNKSKPLLRNESKSETNSVIATKVMCLLPRSNFAGIGPQIEHVVIGRISSPSRQLKKHSKAHIAKLAAGISRYCFLVPC